MIAKDKVVAINFTMTDEEGNQLDGTQGNPIEYLHGHNNIAPGLEKALEGLKEGDTKQVTVPPEEGFGVHNPELQFAVDKAQFGDNMPQPGMMLEMRTQNNEVFRAMIVAIEESHVMLDANHPLAGKTLSFDVEVTGVRDASTEEISHGHPHSPGGHHHDHDHAH